MGTDDRDKRDPPVPPPHVAAQLAGPMRPDGDATPPEGTPLKNIETYSRRAANDSKSTLDELRAADKVLGEKIERVDGKVDGIAAQVVGLRVETAVQSTHLQTLLDHHKEQRDRQLATDKLKQQDDADRRATRRRAFVTMLGWIAPIAGMIGALVHAILAKGC